MANHVFESASFLSNWVMKERFDENHPWVTDDGNYDNWVEIRKIIYFFLYVAISEVNENLQ